MCFEVLLTVAETFNHSFVSFFFKYSFMLLGDQKNHALVTNFVRSTNQSSGVHCQGYKVNMHPFYVSCLCVGEDNLCIPVDSYLP